MKNIKIILLGVLCLALLYPAYNKITEKTTASQKEPLFRAMSAAQAQVEEVSINGWSQLESENFDEKNAQQLVEQAMYELGISKTEFKLTTAKDKYHYMVRADSIKDYCHIVAICQVLYINQQTDMKEVYMVINVETAKNFSNNDFDKRIALFFKNIKSTPRITTCLVGGFDGKLNDDEKLAKLDAAFSSIGAAVNDKNINSQFASFTGYTNQLKENIAVGDKVLNVQMAIRYSRHDNRTYLIIGSPVITREY